ncbi:hypothetical protein PIB30_086040 [Stylosanthes scabra]|uniref:Uncharacterized protein n=1 Tax=Stylosanthes scabra TaxID=79078 RepID=A0ABU6TUE4_9FABA|nr:hypothetical protein [Stylosanthes scabra]
MSVRRRVVFGEVAVVGDRREKEIEEREWECTGSRRKREFEVVLVVCSRIDVVYARTCPIWAAGRGAGYAYASLVSKKWIEGKDRVLVPRICVERYAYAWELALCVENGLGRMGGKGGWGYGLHAYAWGARAWFTRFGLSCYVLPRLYLS